MIAAVNQDQIDELQVRPRASEAVGELSCEPCLLPSLTKSHRPSGSRWSLGVSVGHTGYASPLTLHLMRTLTLLAVFYTHGSSYAYPSIAELEEHLRPHERPFYRATSIPLLMNVSGLLNRILPLTAAMSIVCRYVVLSDSLMRNLTLGLW